MVERSATAIAARGTRRCFGNPSGEIADPGPPFKAPATLRVWRDPGQLRSLRNQPAHRALATMEKRSSKEP